jgi:hypothetical protein
MMSSAAATPGLIPTAAIIPSTAASTPPTRFERDHIDDFMLTASLPERVAKIAACGRKRSLPMQFLSSADVSAVAELAGSPALART